jgi:hypothetical protein
LALFNLASTGLIFSASGATDDFRFFRIAGQMALESPPRLFIVHLPHEILAIFAPLSLLSLTSAFWLWRAISVGLLIGSLVLLRQIYDFPLVLALLASIAFFPVIYCLCMGQDSLLLMFLISASLYVAVRGNLWLAGVILALAIFKPQIPLMIALAMLCSGKKKFIAGFIVGGVAVYLVSAMFFGFLWPINVLGITTAAENAETPTKFISLMGLTSFFGSAFAFPAALTLSVFLTIPRMSEWKKTLDVGIVFGSAILIGSLCAFHFHVHDASLFLIPAAILWKSLGMSEKLALAPYFISPLMLFLMYLPATGLLAISSVMLLGSFKRVMMPGISCSPDPAGGVIRTAVPRLM